MNLPTLIKIHSFHFRVTGSEYTSASLDIDELKLHSTLPPLLPVQYLIS